MTQPRSFEGGKYVVLDTQEAGRIVMRHDEVWRDITGDKFINALLMEIEDLREQLKLGEQ